MHNLETLQISSTHPCLVIYMLDQSRSMELQFGGENISKAKKLADCINEIIFETGLKCYDSNGEIKNRFELSVIGYGVNSDGGVAPAWEGNLRDSWVVSIADVFPQAIGEENGVPIWITPKAIGQTPMTRAFENAYRICEAWINWGNHIECHPPIIINISDGEPTDAGAGNIRIQNIVNQIKGLHTNYGGVNIFNIHISSLVSDSILFPTQAPWGNSANANLLFNLSTELNPHMVALARQMGYAVEQGSKGYVFNGSAKHLMDFLNIGSNPL